MKQKKIKRLLHNILSNEYIKYCRIGLFLILFSCSDNDMKKEYYNNGNLRSIISVNGDIKDGECKYFYSSGELKTKCFYKNGELEGELIQYYKGGGIKELSYFENGKRRGHSFEYYKNGMNKVYECYSLKNNLLEYRTEYDTNGVIIHEVGKLLSGIKSEVNGETILFRFVYPQPYKTRFDIDVTSFYQNESKKENVELGKWVSEINISDSNLKKVVFEASLYDSLTNKYIIKSEKYVYTAYPNLSN